MAIRTKTAHTVTVRRPDPETGEVVAVDVVVKSGKHTKGDDLDRNAALDFLVDAHLAVDEDRPDIVEVTDIITGEPVVIDAPVDPAQEA